MRLNGRAQPRSWRRASGDKTVGCSEMLAVTSERLGFALAKHWKEFSPQPRVAWQPDVVARTRVRQGNGTGQVDAPVAHSVSDRCCVIWKMIGVRVLTNDDGESKFLQPREQSGPPSACALGPRWQVTRAARPGIAETHGQDGDELWFVELLAGQTQPGAQPFATGVIEWDTRFVNLAAGRLPCNQDAGRRGKLEYRPWAKRQVLCAKRAAPNLRQQLCDRDHLVCDG